jgi:hypothetical protein
MGVFKALAIAKLDETNFDDAGACMAYEEEETVEHLSWQAAYEADLQLGIMEIIYDLMCNLADKEEP